MERVLKTCFKSLALIFCLLAATESALATTAVKSSDKDLAIGARAIVRGKVISIESRFDDQESRIYTYITLKVQEVIKGDVTERKIVIKELGGEANGRISVIFGNPQFTRGEKVLLYLDTWKDGSLRTYQMFLGKFSIIEDKETGHEIVFRDMSDEKVTVLPSSEGASRESSTDRMELSAYLGMMRRKVAENAERSREFEARYYSGISILAQPREYVRTASRGDLSPQFTFLGNARWFEPDTNQPVTYTVNPAASSVPGFPPLSVPVADVAAAAAVWSSVPGSALRVTFGSQLNQCYTLTGTGGINVVSNNCDGRNSPSASCAGILAWGGWSGGTFETVIIGDISFRRITQGFVSFNPYAVCWFDNHCNVQEITTHEMGHSLGLGHSADTNATMAAFAHFDGRCAGIKQDDSNAIAFLYPGSSGGPGPLSIVNSTLSGGTVGSSYSQTMSATGGTPPYSWSVVSGSGNLPPGLTLNSSGLLSGSPTTAGTYNFTIRVADTASGSAQKDFSIAVSAAGTSFDAQFLSQSVSSTLTPGQLFTATLSWLNTGTQAWDGPGGQLRLISQNPLNNTAWGGNTVLLTPFFISAGQQLNVTFQAIAPTTPGTYNFQWQLSRDATSMFGQMSANVAITVGSGGGGGGGGTNGAGFVTQNVATTMTAGQVVPVSVTMSNTGTTTWAAGTYLLGSLNPSGNSVWGLSQVALASSVAPGSNATFTFNVTAPASAGSYNFQWGMTQSGVGAFGAASTNVVVTVSTAGGGGTNSALFLTQSVPSSMSTSQSVGVSVTMRNNGTSTWAAGTYCLQPQNPQGNSTWGLTRVNLSSPVAPGSDATFTFTVTAPSTDGTYNFQWRMAQDGVGVFGDFSTNVAVVVSTSSVQPLVITTTSLPNGNKNVFYSAQVSATGGEPAYTWSLSVGSLPSGVTLNPGTGLISGTPTVGGTFNITVMVRDQGGRTATKFFKILFR